MIRKKILAAALALLAGVSAWAAEITAQITSGTVYSGLPAEFSITNAGSSMPRAELPRIPGLRWIAQSSSQRMQNINGRASYVATAVYTFVAEKPGDYTIPALKVHAGKETHTTKPVSFKVTEPRITSSRRTAGGKTEAEEVTLDKLLFSEISVPDGARTFYMGEEIPVEVKIYQARNLRCQLSWPEIAADAKSQILFHDFRTLNPDNPKFEPLQRGTTEIDGRAFNVFLFKTAIRPISFGHLTLTAETVAGIETQNRRRSASPFDDFFDDPFFGGSRTVRHTLRAALPPLEIKALPPRTGNAQFLGLVGKWNVETSLSSAEGKVGEALTLSVNLRGDGALETLKAPALELPGFRVYSPEIEKNPASGTARIKYILIPTREGTEEIRLKFSTFDPSDGKYVEAVSAHAVKVTPSAAVFNSSGGPRVIDAAEPAAEPVAPQEKRAPAGVLYLKRAPFTEIPVPLWRNALLPGGILLLLALAFWIGVELWNLRRKARENDPGLRRRGDAAGRRNSLMNRLNALPPDRIPELDAEIAAYVNDALNLPPGSSLGESADIAEQEDRELASLLRTLSDSSWSGGNAALTAEFKTDLLRKLSRLVCVLLMFGAFTLSAAPAPQKITTPEAAMTAYDEGHFAEAEAYYKSLMRSTAPSAELFYNIGNCLYQQGGYAPALAYYESALRLAPRDSDVLENLNLTRRKLALPERHTLESPAEVLPYLRDSLRPDEWMFLVMAGAALLFVALGLRRLVKAPAWGTLLAIGALTAAVSFAAVIAQNLTSYDSDTAVLLTRNAPLHALPSDKSPRLNDISLQPGEEVDIAETRQNWVRIRSGSAEGWIRKENIRRLWDF